MRVLLVEDNPDDALIIEDMLSATAVEIEHASNLSLALEKLTRGDFDLVLLDLSLPDARGPGMIGLIQKQAPGIPIVVLSGLSDENAAIQTMEQGAQDYLIKGQVDAQLLWRSLRYALQRHAVEERINERNRELLVLKRISETILGSLDLKVVLDRILEEAMVSGCSISVIFGYSIQVTTRCASRPSKVTELPNTFSRIGRYQRRWKAPSHVSEIGCLSALVSKKTFKPAKGLGH